MVDEFLDIHILIMSPRSLTDKTLRYERGTRGSIPFEGAKRLL
jgi:hypothetical protein